MVTEQELERERERELEQEREQEREQEQERELEQEREQEQELELEREREQEQERELFQVSVDLFCQPLKIQLTNMKPIQLQSSIDGVSTRKDGSMGLRVTTQELTPEQKVMLMEYAGTFGWFLFKPSELGFSDDELPKDSPEEPKTLSQRLKAVLYVYARDVKGIPADDRDRHGEFYRQQMEKLIESYKSMLPPL